jgi:hypothetical protein
MGAQKPGFLRKDFVKTRRLGKKPSFEESECVKSCNSYFTRHNITNRLGNLTARGF